MANFPQRYFTMDNVRIRTGAPEVREDYASSPIAQKFAGLPKGIYTGYTPTALGSVLTLAIDGTEGYSLAKVHSDSDPGGMDVLATHNVQVNFGAAMAGDFTPDGVQVLIKASYADGQPTSARIVTRTKTTTQTLTTIGGSPATYGFSGVQLDPIKPGTISVAVTVDGFGAATITDDGNGAVVVSVAAPTGGTIDYETGKITCVTASLAAGSSVALTYTRGASKDECRVCDVTGTPGSITVVATDGVTRDIPQAFAGTDFGFMPAGSIESLAAAVDILNEVIAARTDLKSIVHPSLKERLDIDLGGSAMADRLARVLKHFESNDHQASLGVSEITVSGSLSEASRTRAPFFTLNGGGSELVEGAVTDPPDSLRNVCLVLNAVTGDRLLVDDTTRGIVIGRMRQDSDFILDGDLTFSNALTSLTGANATRFLLQLAAGDTVQGPDGKFYEIGSIASDTQATLTSAYQGATATSGGLIRRRFKLRFRKIVGGVEQAHTLPVATTVRFAFPVFITCDEHVFDAVALMHAPGERPPVPDATTTVPGKIALASVASPYIGSINLQVGGAPVSGGPFHTLNFTGAPGAIDELSPGVIDVTNLGSQGPIGPGAGPGPPGNPGAQGPTLNRVTPFAVLPSDSLGPGPGAATVSHTVSFGYQVRFLSGGIASLFVPPGSKFFSGRDTCNITDISQPDATHGTITAQGGSGGTVVASVILYLDACGSA